MSEEEYVLIDVLDRFSITVWGPFTLEGAKSCHNQQDPEVYSRMVLCKLEYPSTDEFDPDLRRPQ